MTRHVALEGVRNFRDFGDYPAGARRIRKGILYRSAHHGAATDRDLAALAALAPAVIVDLRRPKERTERPCRRWNGFSALVVENHDDEENAEERERAYFAYLRRPDLTPQEIQEWGCEWYRNAPHEPRHIDLFARYFQALARSDGPILIHCAAGKDRTGILAALTHHLLGVPCTDIIEDYLLTNRPETAARGEAEILGWLGAHAPHNACPEIARSIHQITTAHLESAFESIEARSGSIHAYLACALGVDEHMRAAIEGRMLE